MKCPYCKSNLNYLIVEEKGIMRSEMYISAGELQYEQKEFESFDEDSVVFKCPNCRKIVAKSEEEAIELLTE